MYCIVFSFRPSKPSQKIDFGPLLGMQNVQRTNLLQLGAMWYTAPKQIIYIITNYGNQHVHTILLIFFINTVSVCPFVPSKYGSGQFAITECHGRLMSN